MLLPKRGFVILIVNAFAQNILAYPVLVRLEKDRGRSTKTKTKTTKKAEYKASATGFEPVPPKRCDKLEYTAMTAGGFKSHATGTISQYSTHRSPKVSGVEPTYP
jgi:hypothetical protein